MTCTGFRAPRGVGGDDREPTGIFWGIIQSRSKEPDDLHDNLAAMTYKPPPIQAPSRDVRARRDPHRQISIQRPRHPP